MEFLEFSKWLETDEGKRWSDHQQKLSSLRERTWRAAMEWWYHAGAEREKSDLMRTCAELHSADLHLDWIKTEMKRRKQEDKAP